LHNRLQEAYDAEDDGVASPVVNSVLRTARAAFNKTEDL